MATTLSGQTSSITRFLHQNALAFGVTASSSPLRDYERFFASTEITKLYFGTFNVTSTPTNIDVTSLVDEYGVSISFATVKQLLIVNNDVTNNLTVGAGTNALFAALPVLVGQAPTNGQGSNGSCVNLTTNLTVSGSTKIIQLVASAGTVAVDVVIAGS